MEPLPLAPPLLPLAPMTGTFLLLDITKYVSLAISAFFMAMAFAARDMTFLAIAVVLLSLSYGYFRLSQGLEQRKNWARITALLLSLVQLASPLLPLAAWSLFNLTQDKTLKEFNQGPRPSRRSTIQVYKPAAVVFTFVFALFLLRSAVSGNGLGFRLPPPQPAAHTLAEWRKIGTECNSNGDAECARTAWEQALKQEPRNVQFLANLGLAENRLGHHDEAARILQTVVDSGNPTYDTLSYLGMSLEQLGRDDEALKAYLAALSISDRLVDITQKTTSLLIRQNRLEEARALAENFVKKYPEGEPYLRAQLLQIRERGTESATTSRKEI